MRIERTVEVRHVKWRGSTTSEPVVIEPGAGFKLYLPAAFAGSTLSIKGCVEIPQQDDTGEVAVDANAVYTGKGAVASPTAGTFHDLTANNLFGFEKIVFVSDSSETCTGALYLAG